MVWSMTIARNDGERRYGMSLNVERRIFPFMVKDGKVNLDVLRTHLGEDVAADAGCCRMTWNGKEVVRQLALKSSHGTFVPNCASSRDWETTHNVFIEGDNLASLKLHEKTHRGKINFVYIDPPYNAGNKDFIYNDQYVDANDTFRQSKWLSFVKKRLEFASAPIFLIVSFLVVFACSCYAGRRPLNSNVQDLVLEAEAPTCGDVLPKFGRENLYFNTSTGDVVYRKTRTVQSRLSDYEHPCLLRAPLTSVAQKSLLKWKSNRFVTRPLKLDREIQREYMRVLEGYQDLMALVAAESYAYGIKANFSESIKRINNFYVASNYIKWDGLGKWKKYAAEFQYVFRMIDDDLHAKLDVLDGIHLKEYEAWQQQNPSDYTAKKKLVEDRRNQHILAIKTDRSTREALAAKAAARDAERRAAAAEDAARAAEWAARDAEQAARDAEDASRARAAEWEFRRHW